ncbi:hypothetical protein SOVF_017480 [Spinacia oleracea]|nr:hypothetical protein SOVF_017480 [Spinacia oleracea]
MGFAVRRTARSREKESRRREKGNRHREKGNHRRGFAESLGSRVLQSREKRG